MLCFWYAGTLCGCSLSSFVLFVTFIFFCLIPSQFRLDMCELCIRAQVNLKHLSILLGFISSFLLSVLAVCYCSSSSFRYFDQYFYRIFVVYFHLFIWQLQRIFFVLFCFWDFIILRVFIAHTYYYYIFFCYV